MQQDSWQGTLWLAPDFAILHGAVGAMGSHAHYAHQLMLGTGAPFTAELDGIVHTARHLLVESLHPHAILSGPALLAAAGSAGAPSMGSRAAGQPRATLADARVQRALDQVDALLSGKVSAAAVAGAAHLSRTMRTMRSLFSVRAERSLRQLNVKLLD
ncbi:hypothetical protein ACQ4WP_21970 [Janthinobacterium sp. GB4P2]|uniref:hypothetical protein n=1 Tax=Janthinobacterium sp. GB4P2 TaxID=3424189 RepID=UPI003F252057